MELQIIEGRIELDCNLAAKWLGLESKTKKVRKKQYVEVRRMQSDQYDDKPVFDMHTHTQKFTPEHYKGKKKVEVQVSKRWMFGLVSRC